MSVHQQDVFGQTVSDRQLRLGYVTIMDGLPSVVVDTAVTYMGRCPKSKGEHNAEHKQFDRDVE